MATQGLYVTMDNPTNQTTEVRYYTQKERFVFEEQPEYKVQVAYNSQPFYADINGDLK